MSAIDLFRNTGNIVPDESAAFTLPSGPILSEPLKRVDNSLVELLPRPTAPAALQWVELRWNVRGDRIRQEHGYRLYSALVSRLPALKKLDWQLGTIAGRDMGDGWLKVMADSCLMVRCRVENVAIFGALDNTPLTVSSGLFMLGSMTGETITPHPSLRSDRVIVKLKDGSRVDPFGFGVAIGKQLLNLQIDSVPTLGERRVIRVQDSTVVGYELTFPTLRPHEAIALQVHGLGGKRRMGCGVFRCKNLI